MLVRIGRYGDICHFSSVGSNFIDAFPGTRGQHPDSVSMFTALKGRFVIKKDLLPQDSITVPGNEQPSLIYRLNNLKLIGNVILRCR